MLKGIEPGRYDVKIGDVAGNLLRALERLEEAAANGAMSPSF